MTEQLIRRTPTLKNLRIAAGLTQEALARQMGVSHVSISHWERGNSFPRFDDVVRLARFFGVSLKEIAKGSGLDVSGIPNDNYSTILEDRSWHK